MNKNLSKLINEGTITGERRIVLLHGLGEILAKNYIYRQMDQMPADDDFYNRLHAIYR